MKNCVNYRSHLSTRQVKMKRKNRNLIFASIIVIAFAAVVIVSMLSNDQSHESHYTAEEYFEISDVIYTGEKNSSLLRVYPYVIFNISAVQGNATEIFLTNIPGMTEDVYVGTIEQNESKVVTIELYLEVWLTQQENGFPFRFRISCNEVYDWITIYLQWPPPYAT